LVIGIDEGEGAATTCIKDHVKYIKGLIQIFHAKRADVLSLKRRAEVMFRCSRDKDFACVQEVIRATLPAYLNMNRTNVDEIGGAQEEVEEAQLVDEDDHPDDDVNPELDSDMEEAEDEDGSEGEEEEF
jgi:hypothetical protein